MEDFSATELQTKINLQIALMKSFGYVDREKMDYEQRKAGGLRWTEGEQGMAKIFNDICTRSDIRAKLSDGVSDALIAEIKFEMEKILYPEIYQTEQGERRAA
ncbi:MAG: hypothetical protein A3B90_01780 [Candidatus Magasanikbacteria bacterium RIFCSPHIGHO2_02_FULL_41_13]|uniref:Uncharacterized protein n=1 Tax=Candidatus Magasanikbacteria bacterium RIFCSPHIGHO2_02_FULL_41_13 TaxID=1798676 RepID=A0A1F6M412_9BACT|nr:MAG: hypothetical protein A3B90_01780 [Candidatus Magasanikbacteria bacterium RIFCSPHIGHO2_02_FULL_41_13]